MKVPTPEQRAAYSARNMARANGPKDAEWQLYYWPTAIGRGEFARLLFSETNTEYVEVWKGRDPPDAWKESQLLKQQIRPFFALPAIIHTPASASPILLSQTPVIVRYLASQLDNGRLSPIQGIDEYYAQELMSGLVDVVAEGHDAWHGINHTASYESQKKETQPFIDAFTNNRLPRWLDYFEKALKYTGGQFFVSKKLTYVDICVFHWLHGVEHQLPNVYFSAPVPTLRAFKEEIQKRPRITKRIEERGRTYDGTGPIF